MAVPDDLLPPDDPNEAIAQLREQLAAALADSSTKDSTIAELRRQLDEAQRAATPPAPERPAATNTRSGFWNEEV